MATKRHVKRPGYRVRLLKGVLGVTIELGGGRPAYLQLADHLRRRIAAGEFPPGAKIPSSNDLRRDYGVSRMVATMALDTLKTGGEVVTHPGKGTFVRRRPALRRRSSTWHSRPSEGEPTSPTARSVILAGGVPTWDYVSTRETASVEVAGRLGIEPGARVMKTTYVFRADGAPIQGSVSWEPLELTEGSDIEWPEDGRGVAVGVAGVVARFDLIGIAIDSVDELVTARMPTEVEQRDLTVPAGVPVMVIARTYSAGDRAVETADIVAPGDRYQLAYEKISVR